MVERRVFFYILVDEWILLFCGFHNLNSLEQPYWTDYLINAQTLKISYLLPEEAKELIICPIRNFSKIYEPKAVKRIINLNHRQPYFIQMGCSILVDHLNRNDRKRATVQDVEIVLQEAIDRASPTLNEL